MDRVDLELASTLAQLLGSMFNVIGAVIAITIATKGIFLVPLLPILAIYYYVQIYFRKSSTEIQRLESISRSPIFASFAQTLDGARAHARSPLAHATAAHRIPLVTGVSTIRAYGQQNRLITESEAMFDRNNTALLLQRYASNWLGLRLDLIGALSAFSVALLASADEGLLPAAWVAIGLSFSFEMTNFLKHAVRMYAQAEAAMNAVERIRYYSEELEEEPAHRAPDDSTPPASWPQEGAIAFRDLRLRYRDGPLVLKGLTLDVRPQEKVGVVGRTGAGKSSLMNALFRIVETGKGSVSIDGVDIASIGLHDLRERLSIIPQDPVLFSASVRFNLDPFDEQKGDAPLWEALGRVQLREVVEALPGGLDSQVAEGGNNFSVGQRQLICIARALLRRPKVLVMDEATASVDRDSDAQIQSMVRECFSHCTVLTIAHRLHTVVDSDRVLVLDDGHVAELDTPSNLLRREGGVFRAMVEALGEATAQNLRRVADGEASLQDIIISNPELVEAEEQ